MGQDELTDSRGEVLLGYANPVLFPQSADLMLRGLKDVQVQIWHGNAGSQTVIQHDLERGAAIAGQLGSHIAIDQSR
jgi:hypothetical protein